jgi:hypothetical protein
MEIAAPALHGKDDTNLHDDEHELTTIPICYTELKQLISA